MKLTIANVEKNDYGTYKCVAKNPRGETDGTIRLYCEFFFLLLLCKFKTYTYAEWGKGVYLSVSMDFGIEGKKNFLQDRHFKIIWALWMSAISSERALKAPKKNSRGPKIGNNNVLYSSSISALPPTSLCKHTTFQANLIKTWNSTPPTASSPPTTIAPPTTTFNYIPDRSAIDIQPKQNFDSPTYRQPDNNSIQFSDKGIKYQSNLNEIDKFEHKSQSDTASKAYEWPASSKENSVGSK